MSGGVNKAGHHQSINTMSDGVNKAGHHQSINTMSDGVKGGWIPSVDQHDVRWREWGLGTISRSTQCPMA
ncbi:MAG: hypothetical protein K0U36_05630 [Alphaproteobacteria bacterium]|nr:hypothetical protein [Alphaproteobacteria bacterium]